jgi:two-component system, cell cycle sensor histidine kinase and response regulator CckA
MVRNMVFEFLTDLAFDVLVAEGPKQALLKADGRTIDLLMTDVVMPDMTGPELHKRLSYKTPGLRVLFMSGYTNNVILHHGVKDEGYNFISKPFSVNELSQKIQSILT